MRVEVLVPRDVPRASRGPARRRVPGRRARRTAPASRPSGTGIGYDGARVDRRRAGWRPSRRTRGLAAKCRRGRGVDATSRGPCVRPLASQVLLPPGRRAPTRSRDPGGPGRPHVDHADLGSVWYQQLHRERPAGEPCRRRRRHSRSCTVSRGGSTDRRRIPSAVMIRSGLACARSRTAAGPHSAVVRRGAAPAARSPPQLRVRVIGSAHPAQVGREVQRAGQGGRDDDQRVRGGRPGDVRRVDVRRCRRRVRPGHGRARPAAPAPRRCRRPR